MRKLPPTTRAVLLDVEGTVGDIRFVAGVLFPYARERFATFVAEGALSPELAPILAEVAAVAGVAAEDHGAIVRALEAWSDANAKIGPLKALQGLIWRDGYRDGALRAHVYDDVPEALHGWRKRAIEVAVYSSGSVLAQKLYFAHSSAGDLTPLLGAHFDTAAGAKGDRASYERIAAALGFLPPAISFFSDVTTEIDAARGSGMHAVRVNRARGAMEHGFDPEGNEWWGGIGEG